jgi:hypothetical protein
MPVQSLNWNDKIKTLASGDNLSNSQKSSLLSLLNTAGGGLATNPGAVGNKAIFDGIISKGVGGKKFATGTTTSSSGTSTYTYTDGTTTTAKNLVVSGLTFKPTTVIAFASSVHNMMVYSEINDGYYAKTVKNIMYGNGVLSPAQVDYNYKGDVTTASVTSSGFTLPVDYASTSYTWIAIE